MNICVECERLRRAFAEVTRLNVEVTSLMMAARVDGKQAQEVLKEASLEADRRWRAAKAELEEHLATHGPPKSSTAASGR